MTRWLFVIALILTTLPFPATAQVSPEQPPIQTHTRQLRRVLLTLEGRVPTESEYDALEAAGNDGARDAIIAAQIESSLSSDAFYDEMLHWGMAFLRVGRYDHYLSTGEWTASQGIWLEYCGPDTLHANKLGILLVPESAGNACGNGDNAACYSADGDYGDICRNPNAPTATVEPWWAPGTSVTVVGSASSFVTEVPDSQNPGQMRDCGRARLLERNVYKRDNPDGSAMPRCGCGPHLIYCARRSHSPSGAGDGPSDNLRKYDAFPNDPTGQRRAIFEEPARLFAHLIVNDRDFSEIISGNTTLVTQGLQHLYVRQGRQDSANRAMDQSEWWRDITDPSAWREVLVADMNPHLLATRDYAFDPTVASGAPVGIPAAGVLTSIGWMGSFERERPRAARALEVFTCREFNPPPAEVTFSPLGEDPATGGVCKHCHTVIDPAAIHFKRWEPGALRVGGIGPWQWNDFLGYDSTRVRWDGSFTPGTWLTPVTEVDIAANPNARFIDFLPAGYTLLGQSSDGTVGPLGFAKMVMASGEFDTCMARRFYARFGGRELNPADHALYIQKLADLFVASGRSARALIRAIVDDPAFRIGL